MARVREAIVPQPALITDLGEVPQCVVGYLDDALDLPEPEEGVAFIVSRVTAAAVDRSDLYFPYPEIRNDEGQIIGCGSLARFDHSAKEADR